MENTERSSMDINQADLEQLTTLPGIGKSMAEKIIAGRPYQEVEQLLAVQGLGSRTLERIRPRITLGKLEGEKVADTTPQETVSVMERFEAFSQSFTEKFQITSQVVWFVLVSGAASVLLSVIVTLTILAGINRTLNIGRHTAVREIRDELTTVNTVLGELSADLNSVDQRLQAVEGLSGRMATLEADFEVIREDMDQAVVTVDQLSQEVSRMAEVVDGMAEKVSLFDGFLGGLRQLISNLFEPAETSTAP